MKIMNKQKNKYEVSETQWKKNTEGIPHYHNVDTRMHGSAQRRRIACYLVTRGIISDSDVEVIEVSFL